MTAAPALEEDLPGLGPMDHEDVATYHDVDGVDPDDVGLGVEDRGKGFVGGIEGGGERARVVSTTRARGGTVGRRWGRHDHDLPQFLLALHGHGRGRSGDRDGRANGEEVVHEGGHLVIIVHLMDVRQVSIGGQGPTAEGGEEGRACSQMTMSVVEPVHEGVDGIRLEVLK